MVHPFAVSWYAGTLHNFGTSTFWPRALDIYDGSRDQPSSLNIDAYSFSSWVMTFAIEYFWKYIYTQQLRLRFIRNPAIKGCKFTPSPNVINPVLALYQITALRQCKGTWGAQYNLSNLRPERSPGRRTVFVFDVSKQLIQLATLLRFESPADDDLN